MIRHEPVLPPEDIYPDRRLASDRESAQPQEDCPDRDDLLHCQWLPGHARRLRGRWPGGPARYLHQWLLRILAHSLWRSARSASPRMARLSSTSQTGRSSVSTSTTNPSTSRAPSSSATNASWTCRMAPSIARSSGRPLRGGRSWSSPGGWFPFMRNTWRRSPIASR